MRELPATDRGRAGHGEGFPWFVTLISLGLGLGIYVHSTRPALAETERLQAEEIELRRSIGAESDAVRNTYRRIEALRQNPEEVLRALDEFSMTDEDAERAAERDPSLSADPAGETISPPSERDR